MTFTFKCSCGAILMIASENVSTVPEKAKNEGWKIDWKGAPYKAWTDTIPAECPECQFKTISHR